jgi:hypothetical protein
MRKAIYLLFAIIILSTNIKSQTITIEKVIVSNVVTEIKQVRAEREAEGPIVRLYLTIENNTDSIIQLYPSTSSLSIKYRLRGLLYTADVSSLSLIQFMENSTMAINKGEQLKLEFVQRLFLGTNILHMKRQKLYDYSEEILQALPTLQVSYKDQNLKLRSRGIDNVETYDYRYIYK